MESRLTELEVKFSFAEDALETLNQTVIRQQKEIESLHLALLELRQQVQSSQSEEFRSLRDEIPPHY
jgi:SlyX protein